MTSASQPFLIVAGDFVKTGGMDHANYALANYLAEYGSPVYLTSHRVSPDLLTRPNVSVHSVRKPLNSYFLGNSFLDRMGRKWAQKIAGRDGRVVVNGGNCSWGDVNWVHYVHAAFRPEPGEGLTRKGWSRWTHLTYLRNEQRALRNASVVIVNSAKTGRDVVNLIGVPASRVHRVYCGIDPELFHPVSRQERSEAKARMAWSTRPVVAFVGGLGDRRKGFDTLFESWKQLVADRRWEANLAVIGTGTELSHWKSRTAAEGVGERIQFLGFRDDVPEILKACDAMAAPARYEAYGLAVQEALAMGIPAITSRSAGVAERYTTDLAGLLLDDPEDPEHLADRLWFWADHREELDRATLSVSKEIRAHSWDHMSRQFLETIGGGA